MKTLLVKWSPLSGCDAIIAQWYGLTKRALEPNVFYEPAFAFPAAAAFGHGVRVALVYSAAGELLGFFPATVKFRYGVPPPVITGWTHPYAPLGIPLVDRNDPEAVIDAWLNGVASNPQLPRLVLLNLISEDGPFARALRSVLSIKKFPYASFDRHARALLKPGSNHPDYLEHSLTAKKRKELRRQRHRLSDLGALRTDFATRWPTISIALDNFLHLEAHGWKGRRGTAVLSKPGTHQFMKCAVQDLAKQGKACVARLILDERTIAAAIILRNETAAWVLKIAYDESLSRSSPGVQLMLDVTRWLLSQSEVDSADSCAVPNHPMIDHLWRQRLAICDLLIGTEREDSLFPLVKRLESLRRHAKYGAKAVRDAIFPNTR